MKYEIITESIFRIFLKNNKTITVLQEGEHFAVMDDNFTKKNGNWVVDSTERCIVRWSKGCENLDKSSDEFQCFGMSTRLLWKDCILSPDEFHAPNIDRLCEALEQIRMDSFCGGDI